MKSKTIILSSINSNIPNSPKGILTISQNGDTMNGKIRLYNLSKLSSYVKLGMYHNQVVEKLSLTKKNDCYEFNLDKSIPFNEEIYCALIDTSKNNEVVIAGGSFLGSFSFEEQEDTSNLQDNDIDYINYDDPVNNNAKEDINIQECPKDCNKCEDCVYKKYFYENKKNETTPENINPTTPTENNPIIEEENTFITPAQMSLDTNKDEPENNESTDQSNNAESFLKEIGEQLELLFKTYPADEQISAIIPDSKFVKIKDEDQDSYYVVGILYENNEIRYLAYGVPAKYNEEAPNDYKDSYQWLPLDLMDPMSSGYYLIYQDALTGKVMQLDFNH